jgi:hypothetical protein
VQIEGQNHLRVDGRPTMQRLVNDGAGLGSLPSRVFTVVAGDRRRFLTGSTCLSLPFSDPLPSWDAEDRNSSAMRSQESIAAVRTEALLKILTLQVR